MADELVLDGTLEITSIAADWDYTASKPTEWPDFPELSSIQFVPGAANDKLVVKNRNEGGPIMLQVLCENTYDQRIKYFHGQRKRPYIDFSECTLSAGHIVIIELAGAGETKYG